MQKPDYIPNDYKGITVAGNLRDFFNTPFGSANVILSPRRLSPDFNALARDLAPLCLKGGKPFAMLNQDDFIDVASGLPGHADAAQVIIEDMDLVSGAKTAPRPAFLRIVSESGYGRSGFVEELHVDYDPSPRRHWLTRQPTKAGTFGMIGCCYNGPVTEGIRNEDAVEREAGLYNSKPGADTFRFEAGDLFRFLPRFLCDKRAAAPFIHRAPDPQPGQPRLMLRA